MLREARFSRRREPGPRLAWAGKDDDDLVVPAPPLAVTDEVDPREVLRGLAGGDLERVLSYGHGEGWTRRLILGDSLQVMASLAAHQGLRGKVQCIYVDPPYGIGYDSGFRWHGTAKDAKTRGSTVQAFRDSWRDGLSGYLAYLRDRLTAARELLTTSGSLFLQIGDENRHLARALLDEVFGREAFVSEIAFRTTTGRGGRLLDNNFDHLLWYARDIEAVKYRPLFASRDDRTYAWVADPAGVGHPFGRKASEAPPGWTPYDLDNFTSQGESRRGSGVLHLFGEQVPCPSGRHWRVEGGRERLVKAGRLELYGTQVRCRVTAHDRAVTRMDNVWLDTLMGSFVKQKSYAVQTAAAVVERCLLLTTDPGDLVLDPTCGSGTTAHVAEQWGRRWIAIDTSPVALALTRARLMGSRYGAWRLAAPPDVRGGFVCEQVAHVTLKGIADNEEIDAVFDRWQETLEPLRQALNEALSETWAEWQIPREAAPAWSEPVREVHGRYWEARCGRQREIDAAIAARASHEALRDRPREDRRLVRVAGPFTLESAVSPRDPAFTERVMDRLRAGGLRLAHDGRAVAFTSLVMSTGGPLSGEGYWTAGGGERRAGIVIGSRLTRADLEEAAAVAATAGADALVACAHVYDGRRPQARIPIVRARVGADLHVADLENAATPLPVTGDLAVEVLRDPDGSVRIRLLGCDLLDPSDGRAVRVAADAYVCWFVDPDHDGITFRPRQAGFLDASDPYGGLRTALKARIPADAWATLHSDTSRPFPRPPSGCIAVKAIDPLGEASLTTLEL